MQSGATVSVTHVVFYCRLAISWILRRASTCLYRIPRASLDLGQKNQVVNRLRTCLVGSHVGISTTSSSFASLDYQALICMVVAWKWPALKSRQLGLAAAALLYLCVVVVCSPKIQPSRVLLYGIMCIKKSWLANRDVDFLVFNRTRQQQQQRQQQLANGLLGGGSVLPLTTAAAAAVFTGCLPWIQMPDKTVDSQFRPKKKWVLVKR